MLLAYFIYPCDDLPFRTISEIEKVITKASRVQTVVPQKKMPVCVAFGTVLQLALQLQTQTIRGNRSALKKMNRIIESVESMFFT